MDKQRLARGAIVVARYLVAAGGSVAFLTLLMMGLYGCMLLVGALAYNDIGGPLFAISIPLFSLLYGVVAAAGALPVCVVGEVTLHRRLTRRVYLVGPALVLVLILAVTVGTVLLGGVFRVRPGSGVTAPLQWTFDLSSIAMMFLVPPLTYWILLQGARWFLDALAKRFDRLAPYIKKVHESREGIDLERLSGR